MILEILADGEKYILNKEKFLKGLVKYIEGGYKYSARAFYQGEIDPGEIDGEAADIIIQYAIFDEVVYG